MKAEIIHAIPLSGSLEETLFSPGENELLWVRFESDVGNAWLGKFAYGSGPWGKSKIVQVNESQFFILAGGQGYFIDAGGKGLLKKLAEDNLQDATLLPNGSETLVCNDGLRILLVSAKSETWRSTRFSFNGIEFTSVGVHEVAGKFNDLTDDGAKFSFDVTTRLLRCESVYDFDKNRWLDGGPAGVMPQPLRRWRRILAPVVSVISWVVFCVSFLFGILGLPLFLMETQGPISSGDEDLSGMYLAAFWLLYLLGMIGIMIGKWVEKKPFKRFVKIWGLFFVLQLAVIVAFHYLYPHIR